MNIKHLIKKLYLENLKIPAGAEVDERILGDALSAMQDAKETKPAFVRPNIRRIIVRSKIAKLAAAAVILVFVMVGVLHFLPSGTVSIQSEVSIQSSEAVQIPPELVQMPVEKLLEIHFGKAESPFDSSLVAAAVGKELDKLSPREILAIGEKYSDRREHLQACYIATLPPALSEIVEACDFVVHARADEVTLDVSDIKAAILHKARNRLSAYSGAPIKATVQLNIIEAYPPLPSNVGEKMLFWPVFNSKRIDMLEEGKEYLIALKNHGDTFWLLQWNRGVYPVDPNSSMVANLRNGRMPLDDAWEFIMDAYDSIHYGTLPSDQILDYWLAKLQSNNITDCLTAVEYFKALPEPIAPQELVIGAMERFLSGRIVDSKENSEPIGSTRYDLDTGLRRSCFAVQTLDLLTQVADESTVDKMLALYEQSLSASGNIFYEELAGWARNGGSLRDTIVRMFRLTLKRPGPKRRERFLSLYSLFLEHVRQFAEDPGDERRAHLYEEHIEELGKTRGEDIDELLMDMLEDPAKFGISDSGLFGRLCTILGQREVPEFGAHLEQFLANPEMKETVENSDHWWHAEHAICAYAQKTMARKEALQYLVDQYRNGILSLDKVVNSMVYLLEPEDTEFIPFLREAIISDWWKAPILAAEVLPDPCLIPALKEALERDEPGRGMLLQALFACGEEEEAVEMALDFVQRFPNEQDSNTTGKPYDDYDLPATIKFLGTTENEAVFSAIERFTREDVVAVYREPDAPWSANQLQQAAVLALGRLGFESAIERLKQIYESDNVAFIVRVAVALSLYRLGDDAGLPLLEYFVTGAERSLPEVEMVRYYGGERTTKFFQRPILYLHSPRTDALLLETFSHRVFPYGERYTGDMRCYYGYAFAKKHKRQILPLLVEQLSSRDRDTRKNANALLKRLTGLDFGFQPDRFVFQQTEAIERWRSYVDDYLATTGNSAE